jgi:hypothetical protein
MHDKFHHLVAVDIAIDAVLSTCKGPAPFISCCCCCCATKGTDNVFVTEIMVMMNGDADDGRDFRL